MRLFCADCLIKNCTKRLGEEGAYPPACPTLREEIDRFLTGYQQEEILRLAQAAAVSSMDHGESRAEQTVRLARNLGAEKLGIAFCVSLADEAAGLARYLRREGFAVESVICKVGHHERSCIGVEDSRRKPMCNPIAQAEYLNRAGTQLNIAVGLCVGHDSLFFQFSQAPVTVLIAKDHRYENCPARFFDQP